MTIDITTGTKPRNILARERESKAMELRTKGKSYRAIAAELGVSDVAVMKMVRRCLQRTLTVTAETTEEARSLELQRLDSLIDGHWDFATQGDEKSASIVLRCMQRRADLLGLDAPKKVQKVNDESDIDRQLDAIIQRFKSRSQVPVTVEVDCTPQPVDSGGDRVAQLALPCGPRVGEDPHGGGGCGELRPEAPEVQVRADSPDLP